jgi:hypothetical protein
MDGFSLPNSQTVIFCYGRYLLWFDILSVLKFVLDCLYMGRDQQIQAIEESFRLSKLMPVHQTKPELEPVEIIPLLPDFDRVADQFVHIVFDTDPLAEADALTDLDQEARYELESRVCFTCLAFQKAPLSNYKMENEQGINYAAFFTKEVKMHQDMPPIANCQK